MFDPLILTITNRPYVFIFLAVFLTICCLNEGYKRCIAWLLSAYVIAFASEYCSINYGFPYGTYHYIYENLTGEIIIAGVPIWDSLSYSFLTYSSYATAQFLTNPTTPLLYYPRQPKSLIPTAAATAALTTLLDIVIDPVANIGERWFLGKIYTYPHGGFYFGVPLSNFVGWFIVAFVIALTNIALFRTIPANVKQQFKFQGLAAPALYVATALFNIIIALYIGEVMLGMAGLITITVPALLIGSKAIKERRTQTTTASHQKSAPDRQHKPTLT